jgi:hypothetical protein
VTIRARWTPDLTGVDRHEWEESGRNFLAPLELAGLKSRRISPARSLRRAGTGLLRLIAEPPAGEPVASAMGCFSSAALVVAAVG